MDPVKERKTEEILDTIGGYISDIGIVRSTLKEVQKRKDPLGELELIIDISNGQKKVDLRILYNALAKR